jgi:Membrane-associating domain
VYGDYSSASEFYVFVGVTAFLYSLAILIFYVFFDDKYRNSDNIPIVVRAFNSQIDSIVLFNFIHIAFILFTLHSFLEINIL